MKSVSWLRMGKTSPYEKFVFLTTPYLSSRSLSRRGDESSLTLISFMVFLFLTLYTVTLTQEYLSPLNYWETLLFSPLIYFFTEALGALGQLLFFRHKTLPIHRHPAKSISLSDFWGRRWNLWIQDWLRDVTSGLHHRQSKKRILTVFILSGLFHEAMVNLPYWVVYKKSYFGTMMAYFIIQAVALWVDKKMVRHAPRAFRRLYLWLAVVLPSPLFINGSLLTFFGIGHE